MLRTIFAVFLLTTSAFATGLPDSGEKLIETNGYLLVEVRVNGQGPFLFLLDTGATSAALTPVVAKMAGIVPRTGTELVTVAGGTTVPMADADLEIGGIQATAVETLILPLDQPKRIDARIEGVVGQAFLSRFPCLISYRHHRLWLGEDAVRRADSMPEKVTAKRVDGQLVVEVQAEGDAASRKLVLDCGAPALVLSCAGHCPRLLDQQSATLQTNAGTLRVVRGTLSAVQVGNLKLLRPGTVLIEGGSKWQAGVDGLLPTRLFSSIYLGTDNTVALQR